jgi:hypothetical protein
LRSSKAPAGLGDAIPMCGDNICVKRVNLCVNVFTCSDAGSSVHNVNLIFSSWPLAGPRAKPSGRPRRDEAFAYYFVGSQYIGIDPRPESGCKNKLTGNKL